MKDAVDLITEQWKNVRPDLDPSPMGVVGRVSRASRLLERGVKEYFNSRGVEPWEFDVMATLLRSGPSHTLCAKDLLGSAMVSSAALTHRVDRLVERGLVKRWTCPDNRRQVQITLTEEGAALTHDLIRGHLGREDELISALTPEERDLLAGLLRKLLHSLGDTDL
ncbi:MarR family winged helix-turn-helix transcriptional regulator [Bailinhaonella thermotolerans]|uniref:MarR family transcriptional regulator n=1 Tax=Bailinhaonella thermotolerans TaxID=1070861 RepID=A0A3A4A494_9ACTN|nr:MarR family transcriptional regulator [Bailinhaonella thermotolerans]RJL23576.1 MarR family transcriptional regulator [Bailinhaonella thermotolerans]